MMNCYCDVNLLKKKKIKWGKCIRKSILKLNGDVYNFFIF